MTAFQRKPVCFSSTQLKPTVQIYLVKRFKLFNMRQFKVDRKEASHGTLILQLLMIFGTIPHRLEEDELLKFVVHSLV